MAPEERRGPEKEHERPGLERAEQAEMAARPDTPPDIGSTDEDPGKYEEQALQGMYEQAKKLGVENISPEMSREELIEVLNAHRDRRRAD